MLFRVVGWFKTCDSALKGCVWPSRRKRSLGAASAITALDGTRRRSRPHGCRRSGGRGGDGRGGEGSNGKEGRKENLIVELCLSGFT